MLPILHSAPCPTYASYTSSCSYHPVFTTPSQLVIAVQSWSCLIVIYMFWCPNVYCLYECVICRWGARVGTDYCFRIYVQGWMPDQEVCINFIHAVLEKNNRKEIYLLYLWVCFFEIAASSGEDSPWVFKNVQTYLLQLNVFVLFHVHI